MASLVTSARHTRCRSLLPSSYIVCCEDVAMAMTMSGGIGQEAACFFHRPNSNRIPRTLLGKEIEGLPTEESMCELVFIRVRGEESSSTMLSKKCPSDRFFSTIESLSLVYKTRRRRTPLVLRRDADPSVTRNTTSSKSQNAEKGSSLSEVAPLEAVFAKLSGIDARLVALEGERRVLPRTARPQAVEDPWRGMATRSPPGQNSNQASNDEPFPAKASDSSKDPVPYTSKPPRARRVSVRRTGGLGLVLLPVPTAHEKKVRGTFEITCGSEEGGAAGSVEQHDCLLPEGTGCSPGTVRQRFPAHGEDAQRKARCGGRRSRTENQTSAPDPASGILLLAPSLRDRSVFLPAGTSAR